MSLNSSTWGIERAGHTFSDIFLTLTNIQVDQLWALHTAEGAVADLDTSERLSVATTHELEQIAVGKKMEPTLLENQLTELSPTWSVASLS